MLSHRFFYCRGLYELTIYAQLAIRQKRTVGFTLNQLYEAGNGMLEVWLSLFLHWLFLMLGAWYLEQVTARAGA